MKDPQVKELKKPQEPKAPACQCSENAGTSKKAWKEKKNNSRHQRSYQAPKDSSAQEKSTPVTGVNNTSTAEGRNSKKNQNRGARRDPAQATCWNCDKKGHYAN